MSAPAAHQIGAPSTIFSDEASDRELFVSKFDHTPFEFRHRFHESDLFQMPALLRLAERAMQKKNRSHYESGQAAMTGYFGAPPPDVSIVQALEGIADGRNWVILKRIHEEPGYRELLESCTDELSNLSGLDLRRDYFDPIVTVFITSPGRVTPYHMDSEANFLAQAHGRKTVHLYDGNNRNVLSLQDLERFWTGHHDAAKYRDDLERHCWKFELVPGTGVFNPATFPHWVQNGNDVSVSVSNQLQAGEAAGRERVPVESLHAQDGVAPDRSGEVSGTR